jgi:glycosyltransferase involved in cell wall biosynthesis
MSRTKYLDRVLESLQNQTYLPHNLLIIFDGNDNEYLEARNKIVQLEGFEHRLVVLSKNLTPAHSIPERRQHITNIHNQARELIADCDWVFSIEDDGVLPVDAVEKLVNNIKPDTGIITGVELGRWGVPYVGAWTVDDVTTPKKISSLDSKTKDGGLEKIDACGLYCALIRSDIYKQHTFFTNNGLGPDVNLALFARQSGYQNYIDWSVHVTHLTNLRGEEKEIKATDEAKKVTLTLLSGSTWKT